MSHSKQDRDLVSSGQDYELKYVARKFNVTMDELKKIMLEITGTGKPARSRDDIEAALIEKGYVAEEVN